MNRSNAGNSLSTAGSELEHGYLREVPQRLINGAGKIISFLAITSRFIGINGFFKTYIGYILLGLDPSLITWFVTFLVSFGVYTLDKAVDADKDTINIPERSKFLRGKKNLVIGCSLGAYVISMVMAFMDKPLALIIVLFPVIINVAYGTKLPGIPRIKDIPVMKNLVVAMCWALCATMLPAIHLSNPYGFTTDLVMYFMLVKSFLNTILYDVRDIKGDKESSVRTVPILLGPKKTLITLLAINSTLWPWLFFIDRSLRCFSTILIVYGYAYIHYFRERRNPYALDLFVDGEWMLATALLGVLSIA